MSVFGNRIIANECVCSCVLCRSRFLGSYVCFPEREGDELVLA